MWPFNSKPREEHRFCRACGAVMAWTETGIDSYTKRYELQRTYDRVTGEAELSGYRVYACSRWAEEAERYGGLHDVEFGDRFTRLAAPRADVATHVQP